MARAAGVNIDARKDHPYAAYGKVEFNVITAEDGDVWSRTIVRIAEVFESINIIRQCLEKFLMGRYRQSILMKLFQAELAFLLLKRQEANHTIL